LIAGYYAGKYVSSPDERSPAITPQLLTGAATAVAVPGTAEAATGLPEILPEIRLEDLNGEIRSIREWSNGPLVINFWATWCAPCLREMPMLESVWQRHRERSLTIIGIAVDRRAAVDSYLEQTGVTYPILVGQSAAMEAAEAFGPAFAGLPYTVFAAAGGRVAGVYSGELHRDEVDRILALLDDVSAGVIPLAEARSRLAD
jgi:thiol-disulfide isomerase/thioredoxin